MQHFNRTPLVLIIVLFAAIGHLGWQLSDVNAYSVLSVASEKQVRGAAATVGICGTGGSCYHAEENPCSRNNSYCESSQTPGPCATRNNWQDPPECTSESASAGCCDSAQNATVVCREFCKCSCEGTVGEDDWSCGDEDCSDVPIAACLVVPCGG